MLYPLEEKIGRPDILTGRKKEFAQFGKWIANIPEEMSKSRVILARRKSGKTSFIQRIFNNLWNQNGEVIPFYLDIPDQKTWYPNFADEYFCTFASQYISFRERDPSLLRDPLELAPIKQYGHENNIPFLVNTVNKLQNYRAKGNHDSMWQTAASAPHRLASIMDIRFLVILDEFQNISAYIYRDEGCETALDETMSGGFHSLAESKVAPMLVTGSYVRWLIQLMDKYLEAGRLSRIRMAPYLTPEEGLQAVYKYAEVCREPITNDTAAMLNRLCFSDPFFISCVFQSSFEDKDLSTEEGVLATVNYEITDRSSEMSMTWREYIDWTLSKINDRYAKLILLQLTKYHDRYWRPAELKQALNLDLEENKIREKLVQLVESDLVERGISDIQFQGLNDGTLNLILRNRFEDEIKGHVPDLKTEFREEIKLLKKEKQQLQGMFNNLTGKVAEMQLANSFRTAKRFSLSRYFGNVSDDTRLNMTDVRTRVPLQREDGKNFELDIVAKSNCGRAILVEVKKKKTPTGKQVVEDFLEKSNLWARQNPDATVLPTVLALGGFTEKARDFCLQRKIAVAQTITVF